MENTDIDKSIKRANSGGTFKFFETQYLGLNNDIYSCELTFSENVLILLKPYKVE